MDARTRRNEIINRLQNAEVPISASRFAQEFGVSRQTITQDIAILRASGSFIDSLSRGYILVQKKQCEKIFKVYHSDEDVEKELNLIVDAGGEVIDVFVFHKFYGTVRAEMRIRSRLQIRRFLENVTSGKSSLLKNVTSGYHYHTVSADSEQTLALIENSLRENGFLAPLQEFEPHGVDPKR